MSRRGRGDADGPPAPRRDPMILWCDGAHDPAENMRRDRALLASAGAGAPAVLRLYCFQPHGITLGHAQDPAVELDLGRCGADGIPWARRPTGGRAIFHAEEWTYSLAAAITDPEWGGSLAESYGRVARLVLRSLVRLGVPATSVPTDPRTHRADRSGAGSGWGSAASPPCFASTARHEIVLGRGKLVGSAQRRTRGALLQQGSVLLGPGHTRLADYVAVPAERREAWRAALRSASADAAAHLGAAPPLERWADAILAELPDGTRRLDGAEGAFRLTPPESGSYTPAGFVNDGRDGG